MIIQSALAQDNNQNKNIIYNATLRDLNGMKHKGYVVTVTDSAVYMSPEKFALTFENLDPKDLQEFDYSNIDKITLRPYLGVQKTIFKGSAL